MSDAVRSGTRIIDGRRVASTLVGEVADGVALFRGKHEAVPGLAVVRVGEDAASALYVRNKLRQTELAGMRSIEHALPEETSEAGLLELLGRLNDDPAVDGILVQLPLPPQISSARVIETVRPDKDVDGFHVVNAGRLVSGLPGLVPCTPLGCLLLLEALGETLSGRHAVVLGRSNIVGKPMASLLLSANCTVTIAHSRTRDVQEVIGMADILVAAVGRAEMVRGAWLKPGSFVLDVGINRVERGGKAKLVGDVAFDEAIGIAGALTPVPGGVGPMTVACLLRNTLEAANSRRA